MREREREREDRTIKGTKVLQPKDQIWILLGGLLKTLSMDIKKVSPWGYNFNYMVTKTFNISISFSLSLSMEWIWTWPDSLTQLARSINPAPAKNLLWHVKYDPIDLLNNETDGTWPIKDRSFLTDHAYEWLGSSRIVN